MAIFGCHSCGVDITKYKKYEDSPCATCKMAKEYYNTPKAPFYDCSEADDCDEENEGIANSVQQPDVDNPYSVESASGVSSLDNDDDYLDLAGALTSKGLIVLKEAIEQKLMVLLSGVVMRLMRIAKKNPVMFEVIIKKMQFPYMSYAEIGSSMTPAITKQNVLYHLKHAIELFPEISSVFLTDTRFSAGKCALETVAKRTRRHDAIDKIRGILYGNDEQQKAMAMAELNNLLHAPFLIQEDILDYNYYSNDEIELRAERERERNREKMQNESKD